MKSSKREKSGERSTRDKDKSGERKRDKTKDKSESRRHKHASSPADAMKSSSRDKRKSSRSALVADPFDIIIEETKNNNAQDALLSTVITDVTQVTANPLGRRNRSRQGGGDEKFGSSSRSARRRSTSRSAQLDRADVSSSMVGGAHAKVKLTRNKPLDLKEAL